MVKKGVIDFAVWVSLSIFLYVLVYHIYIGLTTLPIEGDSVGYHIPIARAILNGQFIRFPDSFGDSLKILHYYPSSSEVILAGFILLGIPLNLYNVLAYLILFFVARRLGGTFGLKKNLALIFASSVCLLPVVVRWLSAQTVDIWLADFFLMSMILLERMGRGWQYFLKLGFCLGMVVGTKYSGPFFAGILGFIYFKKLINCLSLSRALVFMIPFTVFGLSWYLRNIWLVGNPFYPQPFLGFAGDPSWPKLDWPVWRTILFSPQMMVNAFIGEYLGWVVLLLAAPVFLIKTFIRNKNILTDKTALLFLIGITNFIFYLLLPAFNSYTVMVSNIRFTYPSLIPLMLAFFLVAKKFKKETELLLFVVICGLFVLPFLDYHPKLILLLLPTAYLIFSLRSLGKDE